MRVGVSNGAHAQPSIEQPHTIRALYGVKVSVAPDVDESQTYSGAVYLASSVDSVMALVKSTVPISYHRKGNTVWIEKE